MGAGGYCSEKQHGKWPISAKVANSLDWWIRFTDLVGDLAGLVVTQSLSVTMSTMLKMAAGSHTLSKQLSVEVLLEQGHQMNLALHSKQLVEPFQHVHTLFSFYTENCYPGSACVVHCRVVFHPTILCHVQDKWWKTVWDGICENEVYMLVIRMSAYPYIMWSTQCF